MQPAWQATARQPMSGLALTLLIGACCVGGSMLVACAGLTTLSMIGVDSWRRLTDLSRPRSRPTAGPQFPGSPAPWARPSALPPNFSPPGFSPPGAPPQRGNVTITPSPSAPAPWTPASPAAGPSSGAGTVADDAFARLQPIFSFPRRGEPTRVPAGSLPVDAATALSPGDRIWAYWGASWFPAEVSELQGTDLVKVRYLRSSRQLELLPHSRIRLPNPANPVTSGSEIIEGDPASSNPFRRVP